MELVDHSRDYGNFYAPAFRVSLSGADVVRDLLVAVSQVEADLTMNTPSRFSFTLANCYNLEKGRFETGRGQDLLGLLGFGAEVEVYMGYGDASSTPLSMQGLVTNIATNFPETGAPELTVSGYDHGYPLKLGKSSDSWKDRSASDVVQLITSFHNLNATIESTGDPEPQIEQNQESDWDLLVKLAGRNSDDATSLHFEVYVEPEGTLKRPVLRFGKPRVNTAPVAHLEWGAGLLSFQPEANLAGQVAKVEVYGWDVKRKERIVGIATAADVGPQAKSIAQNATSLVSGKEPTLRLRLPVFTFAEANKRAKAELGELTKKFLTGDGECVGLPELRPDRTVHLDNLGAAFSKIYYVEQATHRIDSGGYRTKFKVREAKR